MYIFMSCWSMSLLHIVHKNKVAKENCFYMLDLVIHVSFKDTVRICSQNEPSPVRNSDQLVNIINANGTCQCDLPGVPKIQRSNSNGLKSGAPHPLWSLALGREIRCKDSMAEPCLTYQLSKTCNFGLRISSHIFDFFLSLSPSL